MNEGMSARIVNEPPSTRAPATGADPTIPRRKVGCIGLTRATHAVKGRDSMTGFRELREDGDPHLTTCKPPEKIACPSRHFLPAGHEVILIGTSSGITGGTTGGWMAVAIGKIGKPVVRVIQPRPI